jgi:hypothetical protein
MKIRKEGETHPTPRHQLDPFQGVLQLANATSLEKEAVIYMVEGPCVWGEIQMGAGGRKDTER